MGRFSFTFLFYSFLTLLVSSCGDRRVSVPIATPYEALGSATVQTSEDKVLYNSPEWVRVDWWQIFNDPQLTFFIETALEKNPTLQEARARILFAAANSDRVRSALFPNFTWGADVSREKLSETGVIPFSGFNVPVSPTTGPFRIPEYFTLYETQVTVNHDFDLWGKRRNSLKSAIGEMGARIADSAYADLYLSTKLATTYFKLQTEYKRRLIAEKMVKNREEYLQLVKRRVQNGIDNMLTQNTAESDLASTKQALLSVEGDIAIHENELRSYLAGDFEEPICLSEITDRPLPSLPLPCDLPLHLLSKRPDIAAQLWLIDSAGYAIKVAKASFYPDFSLMALFGFQTIHFRELFKWPSAYFNVDPAVTLPIFDAGKRYADLRGSEINYDIAVYEYNDLVLQAVREVLDGLAILRNSEGQLKQFKHSAELLRSNLRLATLRVANKIDSDLTRLDREEQFLKASDLEMNSFGKTLEAIVALIKAMGGGYDTCPGEA